MSSNASISQHRGTPLLDQSASSSTATSNVPVGQILGDIQRLSSQLVGTSPSQHIVPSSSPSGASIPPDAYPTVAQSVFNILEVLMRSHQSSIIASASQSEQLSQTLKDEQRSHSLTAGRLETVTTARDTALASMATLEKAARIAANRIETLEKELGEANSAGLARINTITTHEATIREHAGKIAELNTANRDKDEIIRRLENSTEEKTATIQGHVATLTANEQLINRLTQERDAIQKEHDSVVDMLSKIVAGKKPTQGKAA